MKKILIVTVVLVVLACGVSLASFQGDGDRCRVVTTEKLALKTCSNCQFRSQCPVKRGKKYYYLRFTGKDIRLAKRRAHEKTDQFKDRYRYRSGVEATMSEYDRLVTFLRCHQI